MLLLQEFQSVARWAMQPLLSALGMESCAGAVYADEGQGPQLSTLREPLGAAFRGYPTLGILKLFLL